MWTPRPPANCRDSVACEGCDIRGLALFADLTDADLSLEPAIEDVRLPAGATLYRAGDPGAVIYTVREGLLKLEQYLPDGTRRIVSLLRRGHVVGLEATVFDTYEHTAIALHDARLCRLPIGIINRLSEKLHPQLMKKWHESVLQAHECTRDLATGSARRRIARLFLTLAPPDAGSCRLFGREDVGAVLGVTMETASRAVTDLKKSGAVRETGPNLFERDLAVLERIAAEG